MPAGNGYVPQHSAVHQTLLGIPIHMQLLVKRDVIVSYSNTNRFPICRDSTLFTYFSSSYLQQINIVILKSRCIVFDCQCQMKLPFFHCVFFVFYWQ